jgi:hypothetical protein
LPASQGEGHRQPDRERYFDCFAERFRIPHCMLVVKELHLILLKIIAPPFSTQEMAQFDERCNHPMTAMRGVIGVKPAIS